MEGLRTTKQNCWATKRVGGQQHLGRKDAISTPSFPDLRGAANKGKQITKAIPVCLLLGLAQQGVSMNCVSWQYVNVLLEGYPLGSVGQQGLVHIIERPQSEGQD